MKRLAALLLAIAAVVWVRRIGGTASRIGGTALARVYARHFLDRRRRAASVSAAAANGLSAVRRTAAVLGNLINELMANQLQVITGIATTLIALIAGLSLNFERLGRRLTSIAYMTVTTLIVAMLGLIAFAWIAWPWLGLAPQATGVQRLAMILPLVTIIISFSPTMTAAVTAETGARGRLSELVLTMVLVADLVLLVLFSLSMQVARVVFGTESADVSAVARFAWEIGGATAFGAGRGDVRALCEVCRTRGHARPHRLCAPQPGRNHAEL